MESIAVTKPDMSVTRQDVLSPFGLLTALFTEEIARRNSRSTGFYRAMPLAYLEESEREVLPPPPEVRIELNIDLLLNRLLKDAREKEKNEKKPQTPPERILERVVVRERELRTAYAETRRVVIETGGERYTAHMPVKASTQDPEYTKRSGISRSIRADREAQSPKESSLTAADMQKRAGSTSKLLSAVGTAKLVRVHTTAEHKRSDRMLPLASQMLSAPATGGWTPQQRELHPGYPVRSETKRAGGIPAGSILLPDVLRRRREEAIAQSEIRRASADISEAYDAANDMLEWSTEGAEKNFETDRILREVYRAVDKTLRRNASRGDETPTQSEKRGEHRETRSYAAGSEQERDDSYTRARAHATGAQRKGPGHEAGSVPDTQTFETSNSETERTAEHAASAQSADGRFASQNRGTAAASRDTIAGSSEQPAAHEQVYNRPALSVDMTEPEERIPFAAFPEGEGTDVSPELIFREDAKEDMRSAAKREDGKTPAPQAADRTEASIVVQGKQETALPIESRTELPKEAPAELTYRTDGESISAARREGGKTPAPQIADRTEASSAAQGKPETALPTESRTELPKEAPAELTYRTDGEPISAARREGGKTPAPQTAVGTEASNAVQGKPETALPTESRTELPKEAPAKLTYRTDGESISAARREDGKTPAPQTADRTEASSAVQGKPETALPIESRAELPEEAPAELTYRTDGEPISAAKRESGKAPAPQIADRTEASSAVQGKPETALPTESRTELPKEAPAELTYRTDREPISAAKREGGKALAPQIADRTEASSAVQGKPETALPIESREAFLKEASAELIYREDAEQITGQSAVQASAPGDGPAERGTDVRTQITARPDAAIPSDALETEPPAELTYRERTEESIRQNAERRETKASAPQSPIRTETELTAYEGPESEIRTAIPTARGETNAYAELTYRKDTERNAEQSGLRQDGTMGRQTPAQQFIPAVMQHGEAHRAQPQTGDTPRAWKTAGQTVRDIRVASEQGRRRPDAVRGERRNAEQGKQVVQKGQDADRVALPVGEETDALRPPELFFAAPSSAEQPPESSMKARPATPPQSDGTNELPTWARELLEKSGVSPTEQRSAALNWKSGAPGAHQISWTAPAAAQQSVPTDRTELSFKKSRETEELPARQPIGDAEIQRTADRVYKIIEERIRRELRRSGR